MYHHIFKNTIVTSPKQHLSLSILFGSSSLVYSTSFINNDDDDKNKFFKCLMGAIAVSYLTKSTYHFMKFIKK